MRFLEGIEWTLRTRGTAMQRVLCAAMMAVLTGAKLPGGGYACQLAMFAVLLRRGLLVPAAFAGMMTGFVVSYGVGEVICCWQLPAATLLWLTACLWVKRQMPLAVFLAELTAGAVMDVAMSIASSLCEINEKSPDLPARELLKSGLTIGRDIMGTMANTLVLAYIGSALCCMLLMVTYSSNVSQILNREQIAVEILQALAGSIGILAALPLTAITSVLCLKPLNRIKRSVH